MGKRIAAAAFWIYLAVLLRITVFRSGWYHNEFFQGNIDLVPFQSIFSYLNTGQWRYFIYLFWGNVLWFVPFGLYLSTKGIRLLSAVLFTALLSFLIEGLQFILSTGQSETEDIILNTLGGVLGWLAWRGISKWKDKNTAAT